MRVCLLLLVICLVLLVVAEGRSRESKSKSPGSKSSRHDGKVTKIKAKHTRHHSSDSSESSEEHRHNKHKKKHSEKFKSEELFDPKKHNSTMNHKLALIMKHNSTKISGGGSHNKTGKLLSLANNGTHESLNNANKTIIGWKIFTKPNMTKQSVNETNNYALTNFLHNEKGTKVFNGSYLHPNNNKWNNSGTPPSYGWKNINVTNPSERNNMNSSALIQGWKINNSSAPLQGWNINPSAPLQGWNINPSAPKQDWNGNPDPVQGWNFKPSAPDYRKEFSVPDYRKDQTYFDSPGAAGYLQRNPNTINYNNQPSSYPVGSDYNRKTISYIAPDYIWGAPQPSYINNDQYNTDGKGFNSYPIQQNYGSSEHTSSKIAKGTKKIFKALGEGTVDVLTSDALKQAASSYFANPPPQGFIYNPPYSNTKQIYYNPFSKPVGKESLSPDEWRSIIFGNVPRKAETRNLYSAAFPETYQNLDLNTFSEKGRLPDFKQTQYKSFFPRPYYQKLFAGLQNEEINEHFRAKRELSEKGKAMEKVINKFFMHERDCNDTELDARKKRHLMIRPLERSAGSRLGDKNGITNFPFSSVEAIVQSGYGISVYEEAPKEILLDNTSTDKSTIKNDDTTPNGFTVGENLSTTEPTVPISQNRTKLYPVSETIEEFLNKKPTTRLRVIDEPIDKWKSEAASNISISKDSEVMKSSNQTVSINETNWKRIARSREMSTEQDYHWITGIRYSDSEIMTPHVTQLEEKTTEESESITDKHDKGTSSTSRIYLPDSNKHFFRDQSPDPISTFEENDNQDEETSSVTSYNSAEPSQNNGFYFFGVYIDDYNHQKWENRDSNSATVESYELASPSEEAGKTTPVPISSTDDGDIQTALRESSVAIPALSYSSHREIQTEKRHATTETVSGEPTTNRLILDYFVTSKPSSNSIVYFPFKIQSVSSISYKDTWKKPKSTPKFENVMQPNANASIIRAPLITNRCGSRQRMVKGRCRDIW